ncbi:hypothetical protein BU15DRAFT_64975 [Melanogaster broomeanus]|nr:hypothetical protein BU15DRAFT_64975 [Melanogaster broomeanus]
MLIAILALSSLLLDLLASTTSAPPTHSALIHDQKITGTHHPPAGQRNKPQLRRRKTATAQQASNAPAWALWPLQCSRDDAMQPRIRRHNTAAQRPARHASDNATQPRMRRRNTAAQRPSMGAVGSTAQLVVMQCSHGSDNTTCLHSGAHPPTHHNDAATGHRGCNLPSLSV